MVWVAIFGLLVYRRHDRFGSFAFDMGIYDQSVWLLARGHQFVTVRGLDVFGHHVNVGLFLLAPFSWLGVAGPHFMNLLQTASLGLGAVPLYMLARHRTRRPWLALVPAVAFLVHPTTQFLAWELFHPDAMAITPFLFAYLAAVHRRWRWYAGLLGLAMAWKEDVALAAVVLGLLLFRRGERRAGAWTIGVGLGWYLFSSRLLLYVMNGHGPFYDEFFGPLGSSPLEIARTAIVDPSAVVERFTAPGTGNFLWKLAAPFGLVALAAPSMLLIGLPQAVGDLLSFQTFTRQPMFHYAALPLAALALASVEALGRLATVRRLLAGAAVLMLASGLLATLRAGPSPIGAAYDERFWKLDEDPRQAAFEAAVDLVPDGARVSATYQLVPHLTQRRGVYDFPNPFVDRNWGISGEGAHDPRTVEWLALDTRTVRGDDRQLLEQLLSSDEFAVRLDRDGILVAERVVP